LNPYILRFMKNLSLVLNIVLLVAVSVLFYLHFADRKSGSSSPTSGDTTSVDLKIAYINSDTVLKYYEYLKVNKQQLEAKTKKMDQDYRNRAMGLQNEIQAYQRNVNSMTLGQVRATEEDLGKKQQNLQMYQQSLAQQLMEDEAKLNKELYDRVTAFLKKYGEEKGLQVVLKFDQTSDVLFGGPGLDISQEVISGLNEAYQLEKSGGKVKTDTTKKK
jgi:outer membrane protein